MATCDGLFIQLGESLEEIDLQLQLQDVVCSSQQEAVRLQSSTARDEPPEPPDLVSNRPMNDASCF